MHSGIVLSILPDIGSTDLWQSLRDPLLNTPCQQTGASSSGDSQSQMAKQRGYSKNKETNVAGTLLHLLRPIVAVVSMMLTR